MRSRVVVLFTVLLLTLASCGGAVSVSPSPRVAASPFPATLSDFQNRSVTVPSRPERLVSIGPSITAFLFALGILQLLVTTTSVPTVVAQAISIVAATPLNFIGNKMWTFRRVEPGRF